MFSTQSHNILFSKVHSTLVYHKNSLSPIKGYGTDAILSLVSSWYKLAIVSNNQLDKFPNGVIEIKPGYYSIYSDFIVLFNALSEISSGIKISILETKAINGTLISEMDIQRFTILGDLLNLIPDKYKKQ